MLEPATTSLPALRISRGVCRALGALGYATLAEFALACGRRVDVIGLAQGGDTVIVEIKTSPADFPGGRKWPEDLRHCHPFFFAVPVGFPRDLLPAECGLMVADDYGAEIVRAAMAAPMHASRRRAQTLRFALAAALRLQRMVDPQR